MIFTAIALSLTLEPYSRAHGHKRPHAGPCQIAAGRYFDDTKRMGFTRNTANVQTDVRIPRALFDLKMSRAFLTRAPIDPADRTLAQQAQGDIANAAGSVLRIAGPQAAVLYHRLKPCISAAHHVRLGDATIALVNAGLALENARRDHPYRRALQLALDRIIAALYIMPEPLYGTRLREPHRPRST